MSEIARDGVRRLQTLRDALIEAEWEKYRARDPLIEAVIAAARDHLALGVGDTEVNDSLRAALQSLTEQEGS